MVLRSPQLQMMLAVCKELARQLTQNDNTCCSISTLLILSPTVFNHILCCSVGDGNFAKNSIAIIG